MAQPATPDDEYNARVQALIAAYILAEQRLAGGIAGILRVTPATPAGALDALVRIRRLTGQVARELTAGDQQMLPQLAQAAIQAGRAVGVPPSVTPPGQSLVPSGDAFNFAIPHGERSVMAIRTDLTSALDDVKRRITRLPDDVYKLISPPAAGGQVIGRGYTPSQAQAYAWREYIRNGVRGFTDVSGRDWSLSAYVEMSVRTAATRAYNNAHLQVMHAANIHFFTVSDDGHPCPLCQPWQGLVLTDGPVLDPPIRVAATIEQATAAGLFHPNCKHILLPVIPGVTKLPQVKPWTQADADMYALTQKQRRLELDIRKAKRQLEYATTRQTRTDAIADVRVAQARMRAFIDQTGFLRQSRREQLDLANDHLKLPTLT